jgi:ATP-dependent RNA helicase HrpA
VGDLVITYPAALPVSQHRDDIMAAVRDHQIVNRGGETGSGKTSKV